ncbi:glycosyltransferase [Actinoplanes derwentensis]|uniref:Glycosyltransferase involved in cell wall bisynthesis n=1 Tax=Actinoplanes derwentensis TaxID=113562 RepID=A0A1H2D732_9ACTN|nr:glycosyltransferase [Actinoplanes derwentensis]GID89378.1 sugar transferase [Actinoplanes derwentensis]SDT78541.1 Glycosyltransferase involved in cell wall bisynthesis [Actinoplanes derwentensis]
MPASPPPADPRPRILVVGSGWHFLSGISYYTCRLSNALRDRYDVGAILMRRLLPARLYPGRERVGHRLADLHYDAGVRVFDGIDWWAVPSLARAVRFLREFRPDVLVLQWWTGAVLHSYLILVLAARRLGIRVIVEFHEVQDTGEARHRWAARYVRSCIRPLLNRTDGVIVHSRFDRAALDEAYDLGDVPVEVALHGPFDHHRPSASSLVAAADGTCRLLFFGTIRPYKGLEDLIGAFADLGPQYHLTVVGETWEGWTGPGEMIGYSPVRDRITFVNRYVSDTEVDEFFAEADVVVLPYRRSSASGPLHIAMSHGLPVVVTAVGGLVEAAEHYSGTVFVPAGEPAELREGIVRAAGLSGRRHADPSSWERTVDAYARLLARLGHPSMGDTTTSSNQTEPLLSPDFR